MMNDMVISTNNGSPVDPSKITEEFLKLIDDIEDCEAEIIAIKNRNFFERLFSNNTRDLASAMEKQQGTISTFNRILQMFLYLNLSNTVVLAAVMEKLGIEENVRGLSGNEYIEMAKNYLRETLNAAKMTDERFKNTDKQLNMVRDHIRELYAECESVQKNIKLTDKKNILLLKLNIGIIIILLYLLIDKFILKQ
jgi:hypothetical protein